MTLSQFLLIINARRKVVISTLMIVFVLSFVISLIIPKSYVSSTSLVLNYRGVDPLTGLNLSAQLLPGYMPTQVDIATSRDVARMVIDQLKLASNEEDLKKFIEADSKEWMPSFLLEYVDSINQLLKEFTEKFSTSDTPDEDAFSDPHAQPSIQDSLADILLKKLTVSPAKESSVLVISYKSSSPYLAAKLANAFAEAYQQKSVELKVEPARRVAEYVSGYTKELRANLEKAEEKLMLYKKAKGLTSENIDLDAESIRLNSLTTQLVGLQSQVIDVNSRLRQKREAELTAAVAAQKERLLALNLSRGELSVLQRDVDIARKALETAGQSQSQNSLQGSVSQSDIGVLSQAIQSKTPASPKTFLNLILSIFVGTALGLGFALLAETLDRKVRGRNDVADTLGVPVFVLSARTHESKRTHLLSFFKRQSLSVPRGFTRAK